MQPARRIDESPEVSDPKALGCLLFAVVLLVATTLIGATTGCAGSFEVEFDSDGRPVRVIARSGEAYPVGKTATAAPAPTPRETADADFNRWMDRAWLYGEAGAWLSAQEAASEAAISAGLADQNDVPSTKDDAKEKVIANAEAAE